MVEINFTSNSCLCIAHIYPEQESTKTFTGEQWKSHNALIYVSLQLLMQNRKRKWHFPLNFQNGIN